MPNPIIVSFVGGCSGSWLVERVSAVAGDGLPAVEGLTMLEGLGFPEVPIDGWVLRGTMSNTRYTNRLEVNQLAARQEGLGRSAAACAALIPITKSEAWWALAQDERWAIIEEDSRHISMGMDYLPDVARRLHHSRELGEPFDFLTWFEYAPESVNAFEELVNRLRATREWNYVDREVDIRLRKAI